MSTTARNTTMVAFHGDPAIKEKYLARVRDHAAADQIIKSVYWENGKGCAVGCTVHSDRHGDYESDLGIPRALARLEDCIFEGLPNEVAVRFPLRFLSAIPVGADLSLAVSRFLLWLLTDEDHGVIRFALSSREVVERVGVLLERRLSGDEPTSEEWAAAGGGATAYSADAAYADAAAYAADDGGGVADATAYAAVVVGDVARKSHYVVMADYLIDLLTHPAVTR